MPRYAKRGVTKEELERRIEDAGGMEEVLYLPKIQSDLKKVDFDSIVWFPEQDTDGFVMPDYEIGFETLSNGVPVFWTAAGDIDMGEQPVAFCIYVGDDGSLRAYIPKEGNCYNIEEKKSFRSADYDNGDDFEEVCLDCEFDMDKLREAAAKRIIFKQEA